MRVDVAARGDAGRLDERGGGVDLLLRGSDDEGRRLLPSARYAGLDRAHLAVAELGMRVDVAARGDAGRLDERGGGVDLLLRGSDDEVVC